MSKYGHLPRPAVDIRHASTGPTSEARDMSRVHCSEGIPNHPTRTQSTGSTRHASRSRRRLTRMDRVGGEGEPTDDLSTGLCTLYDLGKGVISWALIPCGSDPMGH